MTNLPVSELKANDTVYDVFGKGVINQNNSEGLKFWTGTREEYDSIEHSSDTVYNITDEGTTEYSANKNLSNLSSIGKNITNWSSNVTNCITYIPQDIKLELNNGTLTLKAGSKVYIPNGSGVFDEIVTTSDITETFSWAGNYTLLIRYENGSICGTPVSMCYSGSSATASDGNTWYDTTNNVMKGYADGSWSILTNCSLPIAIIQCTSNVITSINQIFNGFGFIGSTVFALPGVKGLIPDGRNAEGTLKSTEFTTNSVLVTTFPNTYTASAVIAINAEIYSALRSSFYTYDLEKNYNLQEGVKIDWAVGGLLSTTNGKITSFNPKTIFHELDYNDGSYISSCAMPSDRYIDLTLGY